MWSELWPWIVFGALVVVLLTLDLAFFHRRGAHRGTRASALWSALFVGVGLSFAIVVGFARGTDAAFQYQTAFLIEESLSVDNLFVFLALFTYFGVPREHQHRVLFWGIVVAIVMRGLSDGTWLTESEGSNLRDSINEPLPVNPADFIYTLGTSLCEVLLDPGTAPAADTEHTVLYEARGNGLADMKVQLKQGAAVIAEWTETAVPVAATRYTHTLTVPQAASITDYTALRLVSETFP